MRYETDLLYGNVKSEVLISVIIPTYKRNDYLKGAIESVFNQDGIDDIPYELLIISNNPNDNMEKIISICRNKPVSIYRNKENYGMISNINLGIKHAKGKYVAFLHDDDLLLPNYFLTVIPLLNGKWDCLVTSRYIMPEEYKADFKYQVMNLFTSIRYVYRKKVTELKVDYCALSGKNIYFAPTCGTIFRKSSLMEYGLFKDISGLAWDGANFIEFNRLYKVALIHKYTGIYRIFTGVTNNMKTLTDFYEQSVKLYKEESKNHLFLRLFKDEYDYNNIKIINPMKDHSKLKCIVYSGLTMFYYFFNNLDGTRLLPKYFYKGDRL